jgi:hypothetical protein
MHEMEWNGVTSEVCLSHSLSGLMPATVCIPRLLRSTGLSLSLVSNLRTLTPPVVPHGPEHPDHEDPGHLKQHTTSAPTSSPSDAT